MKNFQTFDSEDDSKGKIFMIDFFDGKNHTTLYSKQEAVEYVMDQKSPMTFWATNLGYDINNIFYPDHLHLLKFTYVESRLINAKILYQKSKWLYDTVNHWKIGVKAMGERIGLPKLEPIDGNFNNIEYCRRDNEITYHFTKSMLDIYNRLGVPVKSTIGSTTLAYYQEKWTKFERVLPKDQIQWLFKGYYGGRTEIFYNKSITGDIRYFDFNSLYPAVLSQAQRFPWPEIGRQVWTRQPDFERKEGMVRAKVEAPPLEIPYLPFRDEKNRLIFPVGEFTGYWTYFEIREALKLGYKIKKIYRALEFNSAIQPFKGFVDTLYKERQTAVEAKDTLMSSLLKDLMNNLYGKLAQGNMSTELTHIENLDYRLTNNDTVLDSGMVLREVEREKFPTQTNVIIPAYVTAIGRHRLYQALCKIVKEKTSTLMYCDTDSVIFECKKAIFEDSKELGELKSEGEFSEGYFKLPKLYRLTPKDKKPTYKTKGVPRSREDDKKRGVDPQIEYFENSKTKFRKPLKLREVLRRNYKREKPKLVPNFWEEITKKVTQVYDKRIVLPSGETKPLTIKNNKVSGLIQKKAKRKKNEAHTKKRNRNKH